MTGLTPTQEQPMTQEQLDAIQERVDKATAGPWARWAGMDDRDNSVASDGREDAPTVADVIPEKDDAAFIAHARQDIPVLLAEVERLRARLTVDDAMVERAARESWCLDMQGNHALWAKLLDEKREPWRNAAYIALEAALNPRDGS